ncbi:serine/threonine-protein kinase PLK2-like [Macrosteles quadrilineatus]|uniref:serine/threonine-protein kinase PLK2-like n=1 Tax=Macrosteles quadrilineatus TaxID=74068 RepID=UPI0023E26FA7|nr:serine/threonine-protein kinase PLK2-like [Macrosteles quadrilineatus]
MAKIISDGNGNSFAVGEYIDKGSFSQVYKLECVITKRNFAGKFVSREKLQRYGIGHKVWDEIRIHQGLRHKNIVQFYSHMERESHIIIVLEYCSRYSMVNILHALKTLSANEAKFFMIQILSAVEYLHHHHICHRDLKLGNLFVNSALEIKLGDFGLAVVIEYQGQKRFSRCGTPNYISPEVINGTGHSYEVDVWALGCILYTMMEGTPPFQGKDTTSTYNNILRCKWNCSSTTPLSAKLFINCCLQKDATRRPDVFHLKKLDFVSSDSIRAQAPEIDFEGDKITSMKSNKRKVTDLWEPQKPVLKDFVISNFDKLLKCLGDVENWSVSKFGEFLSESSLKIPLIWVNSWMDFTNVYGFAYQLNNHNFGIIFNDGTRMLYKAEERCVQYQQKAGASFVCKESAVPESLKKKLKILTNCKNYMSESLRVAHHAEKDCNSNDVNWNSEVFYWTRGPNETAMFMTNGSIQVNFASDHTKVIICSQTKTVTVIERVDFMKTLKLSVLEKCGCSIELKNKLVVACGFVKNFLTEESERFIG